MDTTRIKVKSLGHDDVDIELTLIMDSKSTFDAIAKEVRDSLNQGMGIHGWYKGRVFELDNSDIYIQAMYTTIRRESK